MFHQPESRALSTLSPTTQRRFCSPSPPFHPSFLGVLPPPPTLGPLDRQPLPLELRSYTLCSPEAPPHPKLLLFSGCVCAHPHPHRLRPGARCGGGWKESCVFFSLFDFVFLSPFQPIPFPHQKKKKTNTNKISKRNYTFGPGCLCLLCPAA